MDKEEAPLKRSVKTLLLLCALLVCIGGYWLLQQQSAVETVSETTGEFDLNAKTLDDLTGLQWVRDDVTYDFVKADGVWAKADEATYPVDQDALDALAEDLIDLTATRKLEDVTSPADYGLEEPAFTVTAAWSDGTSTDYIMGDETPFSDGYYLQLSDQDGVVYTIASSLDSAFADTLTDLAEKETLPEVETVTRMALGDSLDVTWSETSRNINPEQHWYDTATGEPLTDADVEDLIASAQSIGWETLVAASVGEEDLSTYGLGDAEATQLVLYNGEEAAMTLLLGAEDESGDLYARLPGSGMVYTVASEDVSDLMDASLDTLWSKTLLNVPYDQLQEAVLTADGVSRVFHPQGETVLATESDLEDAEDADSADTGEADAAEADADEEEETVDPFEELWNSVIALTATDRLTTGTPGSTVLTVQATDLNGITATLVISEYNVDSYVATMEGRSLLVSADTVDKLVRTIKQGV